MRAPIVDGVDCLRGHVATGAESGGRRREEFVDDLCKVPSVAEASLPASWEYYNLDEYAEYAKAETALIHMDTHVGSFLSKYKVFNLDKPCGDETINVYRCFAAAQALVARKESDP